MRSSLALCALAVMAAPALAQIPRPNVELDGPLAAGAGRAVASGSGIAAQLFKDAVTQDLYIVNSLDDGLTWSPPVQIDITPGSKFVQYDSLHIVGTDAHCGWSITSPGGAAGEDDFAYCIVDVSGPLPLVTFPEIVIAPSPLGPAGGQIRSYEFEACLSPTGGVNVAFLSNFDPTAASLPTDEVWVVTAPGGPLFTPPVAFSTAPLDADQLALACDGDDLAVIWVDNSLTIDTLWLTTNRMGGLPLGWSAPVPVNAFPGVDDVQDDVDVDVKGSKIFCAWLHEIGGTGPDDPFGRTFALPGPVPAGPQLALSSLVGTGPDADVIRCRLSAALNPVAMFDYSLFLGDVIFATTSTDCGLTVLPEVMLSASTGQFIEMADGPDGVVAGGWSAPDLATVQAFETAYSCDDGVTWTVVPDTNTTGGDVDFGVIAYDPGKRNIITGHNSDLGGSSAPANDAFAGGYSVCVPAVALFRNGSGVNPASLTMGPVLVGGTIVATVDLTTTGHTVAVLFGFDTGIPGVILGSGQELLCLDLGGSGELLTGGGKSAPGPMAMFSCPVPNNPCLLGFTLCIQAIHAFGVSPFALSNAYDVTVGSL